MAIHSADHVGIIDADGWHLYRGVFTPEACTQAIAWLESAAARAAALPALEPEFEAEPVDGGRSLRKLRRMLWTDEAFWIPLYGLSDPRQGIVHIIGPEQGFIQPGMTAVCGDSHTSTHGAFGALAFGIGTSEVELVLATQALRVSKRAISS